MRARLPAPVATRLVRGFKRQLLAVQTDRAREVLQAPVRSGDFSALRGKHALLITYRRDGSGVPTPVWFARDAGKVYVWTEVNAYKARRLRNDPRALLAPCTARGVPLGDPVAAHGRILATAVEREHAAAVIRRDWGLARGIVEAMSRPVTEAHYLEFTPAG